MWLVTKNLSPMLLYQKTLPEYTMENLFLIWRAKMTVENFGVKHIGFILDGNGRWAKKRGKERLYGHKMGVEAVRRTIDACLKYEIKYVSLFCFSTENWKRDKYEVDGIFKLLENFIDEHTQDCINKGVRVSFLGDRDKFDDLLREKMAKLEYVTKDFDKIFVNIMLNYGSRDEIVRAINLIIHDNIDKIDYNTLRNYLWTKDMPDPDLIVRTSGEQRLSNFMLLQSAYSELYFPRVFWPSFSERWLKKCLKVYSKRHRRFGKV